MKKILLILTILLICMIPQPIYASAGGGSAGSSGGSSGSSGSSDNSHIYHDHDGSNNSKTNYLAIPATLVFIFVSTHIYAILRLTKARKKHNENIKYMKHLQKNDSAWNIIHLKKRVNTVFYATQNAWTNQNCEGFKPYLTTSLYDNWCTQIEWQKYRKERNVLKNIHLLTIHFVDIYHHENHHDFFCVYIRARMIDYIEDEYGQANKNQLPGMLYEYWYFQRIGDEFYLNEIKQINEVE